MAELPDMVRDKSRPSRARELKLGRIGEDINKLLSRPSRARELKRLIPRPRYSFNTCRAPRGRVS